jgi:endo-1,4-beta-xylanase
VLNACLRLPRCISFTVWGFEDTLSRVPETFGGQGAADIYDHDEPKPQYAVLQRVLRSAPKAGSFRS